MSEPSIFPVIAIDGPSASGKGTVAARVAAQLGFHYLDSGSLYRVVAHGALQAGLDLADEPRLAALARALPVRFEADRVIYQGDDISLAIRSEAASAAASRVAVLPAVREALLDRQRAYSQPPGLVAEGRDMASVVFPQAQLKVFLTASVEARAIRRYKQLMEKGLPANIAHLSKELAERDLRDATRSVAPLKQSEGAHLLDTTHLGVDEAVSRIVGWWRGMM
ncbi:MAG: hypothetical protein RIR70_1300 [Pseudomonadota bacterium]